MTLTNHFSNIKQDFPILNKPVYDRNPIYFDNAATTQKPKIVIDSICDYYNQYNANIHRGIYKFSEQATEKYIEWTTTAKENNITDLKKDIKVTVPELSGYFSYGEWKFDWNIYPFFKYLISENKGGVDYALILYTGEMQASDNQYIDSEGKGIIYNWHCVDHVGFSSNKRNRDLGFGKIFKQAPF